MAERRPINDELASRVWKKEFGYSDSGYDKTGEFVRRNNHSNYDNGWNVDHKKPLSKGGTDHISNLQVLSAKENNKKGDTYPTWYDTKGKPHTE